MPWQKVPITCWGPEGRTPCRCSRSSLPHRQWGYGFQVCTGHLTAVRPRGQIQSSDVYVQGSECGLSSFTLGTMHQNPFPNCCLRLSNRIAFGPQTEISILKEEILGITARKTIAHLSPQSPSLQRISFTSSDKSQGSSVLVKHPSRPAASACLST